MEKIELKEMPSKELLERFLGGVAGGVVEVTFDTQEGVFIDHVRSVDTDTSPE